MRRPRPHLGYCAPEKKMYTQNKFNLLRVADNTSRADTFARTLRIYLRFGKFSKISAFKNYLRVLMNINCTQTYTKFGRVCNLSMFTTKLQNIT